MNASLENLSFEEIIEGKIPGTEEHISYDLLVAHGQTLTLPQVADLERLLILDPGNPSVSSQLFGAYMHFIEVHGSLPTGDESNGFCHELLVEGRVPGTDKEIPNYPYFRNIRTLTRPQVAALERLLEAYPDSYPLRVLLFDYYCLTFDRDGVSLTEDEMNACRTHYVWIIDNRPDVFMECIAALRRGNNPQWYAQVRDQWLRLLDDNGRQCVATFRNAFDFVCRDEPEIALYVARKSQSLEAAYECLEYRLHCVYVDCMLKSEGTKRKENAKQALERIAILRRFQTADGTDTPADDFYLGLVAVEAGDLDCARECVDQMQAYGGLELEFLANTVMGLIALAQGDMTTSREFMSKLLDAKRANAREIDYRGYALAKKMYAYGEVADVLTFLRGCENELSSKLVEQIERGIEPDWPNEWEEYLSFYHC